MLLVMVRIDQVAWGITLLLFSLLVMILGPLLLLLVWISDQWIELKHEVCGSHASRYPRAMRIMRWFSSISRT